MGACLCKQTLRLPQTAAPWPDLPPELAGLVFCRLPSHHDRCSFRAVCHAWRLAAQQQRPLPPAMPCIDLGAGAYQSLVDGKVRRSRMCKGYRAAVSFGGWLFYYHERSRRSFLRAPFSAGAATMEVPAYYHESWLDFLAANVWTSSALQDRRLIGRAMYMKMVVCSPSLVVAILGYPRQILKPVTYFASFRPGQRRLVWSYVPPPHDSRPIYVYTDIAFYNGKAFVLSSWEDLFCHHVDGETHHRQREPIIRHINKYWRSNLNNSYLVVSSDKQKLLMVRWKRRSINDDDHPAMDLWVYEADFGQGRWLEVMDLGGQVLFLGRNCSMAFAAGSSEHWGPRFRGGNRVFILGAEWARSLEQPVSNKNEIPSYCVYDMTSRETSLVSLDGPHYMQSYTSGWFFPLQ